MILFAAVRRLNSWESNGLGFLIKASKKFWAHFGQIFAKFLAEMGSKFLVNKFVVDILKNVAKIANLRPKIGQIPFFEPGHKWA